MTRSWYDISAVNSACRLMCRLLPVSGLLGYGDCGTLRAFFGASEVTVRRTGFRGNRLDWGVDRGNRVDGGVDWGIRLADIFNSTIYKPITERPIISIIARKSRHLARRILSAPEYHTKNVGTCSLSFLTWSKYIRSNSR